MSRKEPIVKMIRLLEYTGTQADIDYCIKQNAVQGYRDFGRVKIRSVFLPFPEEQPQVDERQMDLPIPGQHEFWQKGDEGCPEAILDRNGDVVLGLCKVCNQGEAELEDFCPGSKRHPISQADEE